MASQPPFLMRIALPDQNEVRSCAMAHFRHDVRLSFLFLNCRRELTLSCPSCAPVLKRRRSRRPLAACPVTLPGARRGSSLHDRRRSQWWGEGSEARLPRMTSRYSRWGRGRGDRRLYGRRRADDYGDVAGMPRAWKVRYFLLCVLLSHAILTPFPRPSLPSPSLQLRRNGSIKPVVCRA